MLPHPLRVRANGRAVYAVHIKLWSDDVSGNRSKQWNKHYNWCWTHAGLPQRLQHQEYFVRFLSTSPHATPLEQSEAIQKMLKEAEDGFAAYDSIVGEEIFCIIGVLDLLDDNPMQSELAGHMGTTSANHNCRVCEAGGSKKFKRSDEGYEGLYNVRNSEPGDNSDEDSDDEFEYNYNYNYDSDEMPALI